MSCTISAITCNINYFVLILDRLYIPVEKHVALQFLATPGEYCTIAHFFGIARCTVCIIVNKVCKAIICVLRTRYS